MNTTQEPPALRLLGAPALSVGSRSVPFTNERPFLLLALLACRRTWVRRDELADLLYPGRDLSAARSNLRKVLHLARHVEGAQGLEQQGDLLRWAPDSDLARFEAACGEQQLERAVALYGGPLLLGLDGAWPADAAEWLHAERQRLHARWHDACLRRLEQLAAEPAAAIELAQALLRTDPLDDTALQALGRAQLALGRPAEALAQLRGFEQRLSAQAGLQPSAALRALSEELQGRAPERPADTPGLVGRRQELAQTAARLAEPGCRLLTVLGGPGVGKSSLVRAAQARHAGPSVWVPLEDLQHADQVPARVAALAGLALDDRLPPWPAVARALGAAPRLLVLDNAEHLALGPCLRDLLAACPALQLLVASREPLGLEGEWRLPIAGLPLPDADETDAEVLRANDAVLLFERRARPLAPAFDLAAEAADVVRLVHEVEGLPLAIELLAAWRRLMPVREILAELAESLDLLEPATPNERSVRASFARAWQQLAPLEQRVLAQMAALPGPLSRAQVRAVLQAPLPALAALADRSLLRAEDDGSFTLHPLIRRCAAPLAQDLPALRERHARQLAQRLAASDSGAGDEHHVRAAWAWAVEQADSAVLGALAWPLRRRHQSRATSEEGLQSVAAARAVLQRRLPAPPTTDAPADVRETARALVRVALSQQHLLYSQGRLSEALAIGADSLTWADALGDSLLQGAALGALTTTHWQRGEYQEGLALMDRAAALRRANGDTQVAPVQLGHRALLLKALGRYEEARADLDAALAEVRRLGRLHTHLFMANNQGNLLRLLGREREALELLHEALRLCRSGGHRGDEPFLLTNIALVHEQLREHETALAWAEQAVASAQEHGEPMIEVAALLAQARLSAALRHPAEQGLAAVGRALPIAQRVESEPMIVQCVSSVGVVLARHGRRDEGLGLVRWAQRQASFARSEREDAERHLATLKLDPAEEAAALRLLPPDTPLAEVLGRLKQFQRP